MSDLKHCRSCGAEIFWAITRPGGKSIPLDAKAVPPNLFLFDNGYAIKSKPLFQTHFATCPDADRWRGETRETA